MNRYELRELVEEALKDAAVPARLMNQPKETNRWSQKPSPKLPSS